MTTRTTTTGSWVGARPRTMRTMRRTAPCASSLGPTAPTAVRRPRSVHAVGVAGVDAAARHGPVAFRAVAAVVEDGAGAAQRTPRHRGCHRMTSSPSTAQLTRPSSRRQTARARAMIWTDPTPKPVRARDRAVPLARAPTRNRATRTISRPSISRRSPSGRRSALAVVVVRCPQSLRTLTLQAESSVGVALARAVAVEGADGVAADRCSSTS